MSAKTRNRSTLLAETQQAIIEATDFDDRHVNHNFNYDESAYETVARNFKRLLKQGDIEFVMELSLELMARGSRQVEMSDEGLMSEDIEECLNVAIQGIMRSDLDSAVVRKWCSAMQRADRVGFIADKELKSLQSSNTPQPKRK